MKTIARLILCLSLLVAVISCAHLQPGADPLIVRCEQVETNAALTINLVMTVEKAAQPYFKSNLPTFDAWAEAMRQPVNIQGTNWPKGLAVIVSLDMVKRDYKASRATSNALYEAIATVEGIANAASYWLNTTTNRP